jgi:hypothetical protein
LAFRYFVFSDLLGGKFFNGSILLNKQILLSHCHTTNISNVSHHSWVCQKIASIKVIWNAGLIQKAN